MQANISKLKGADGKKLIPTFPLARVLNSGMNLASNNMVRPGEAAKKLKIAIARKDILKASETDPALKGQLADAVLAGEGVEFMLDYYVSMHGEDEDSVETESE